MSDDELQTMLDGQHQCCTGDVQSTVAHPVILSFSILIVWPYNWTANGDDESKMHRP